MTPRALLDSHILIRCLADPRRLSRGQVRILPLTIDIATEVSFLRSILRDPADRVIVATARVRGLRLLTSDQRILESPLVSTVE